MGRHQPRRFVVAVQLPRLRVSSVTLDGWAATARPRCSPRSGCCEDLGDSSPPRVADLRGASARLRDFAAARVACESRSAGCRCGWQGSLMGSVSFGPASGRLTDCGALRWNAFPGYEWYSERVDASWETFSATSHFGAGGSSDSAWKNCVHRFAWGTLASREMSAGWAPGDELTRSAGVWSVRFGL